MTVSDIVSTDHRLCGTDFGPVYIIIKFTPNSKCDKITLNPTEIRFREDPW